jgi:hypothetical protein
LLAVGLQRFVDEALVIAAACLIDLSAEPVKLCGRRKVAPVMSPSKTWEGLVGGVASATTLGAALYWITPFAAWQAALMALAITTMGFFGGLVMSAIKRDCGAKDWGRMIEAHGGLLDRLDSVAFAGILLPAALRLDLSYGARRRHPAALPSADRVFRHFPSTTAVGFPSHAVSSLVQITFLQGRRAAELYSVPTAYS